MTEMSETPPEATRPKRRPMGCLLRALIAIAGAVALVIAIGFAFDQGDNADQPQHGYDAGQADAYTPGTVNYLEAQHVFVTRLPDGGFVALYDLSTRQQELGGDCRLQFQDTAGVGTLDPLPGITGAIVEECNGIRAVWRADGMYAFGADYGDLDRFGTSVDAAGHLVIDTDSRSCTRSRGVIGVKPYDKRRCEGAR
jgi:hypothetical protein